MFNMKVVETTRLEPTTRFKFRCYPGISCFTRCCSNIDIMLTPYDVLRLARRLKLHTTEFLEKYTYPRIDDKSSHPYIYLRLLGDEERKCPFVKDTTGCEIYTDRPVSCRYYPVGQGMVKSNATGEMVHEEFYFFVREEHCKGFAEPNEWTIQSWREDQDSAHYDDMNKEWKELMMRRNLPGQPRLDTNKQAQFYLASYDHDRFRSFIFESRFLDVFVVPEAEAEALRTDDVVLLKFGVKYLKYIMMIEKSLEIREGVKKSERPAPPEMPEGTEAHEE